MVTYTKLPTREWGVRVTGEDLTGAIPGAAVTVRKRSGEAKTEILGAQAGAGDGWATFAVARSASSPSPAGRQRGAWRPCGYPGCNPGYCDECDGMGLIPAGRWGG
jgi:hypothetical protein